MLIKLNNRITLLLIKFNYKIWQIVQIQLINNNLKFLIQIVS